MISNFRLRRRARGGSSRLLHDSPGFALADLDLDATLTMLLPPEVARIVAALRDEPFALDTGPSADHGAAIPHDPAVATANAADKIVSIRSVLD